MERDHIKAALQPLITTQLMHFLQASPDFLPLQRTKERKQKTLKEITGEPSVEQVELHQDS